MKMPEPNNGEKFCLPSWQSIPGLSEKNGFLFSIMTLEIEYKLFKRQVSFFLLCIPLFYIKFYFSTKLLLIFHLK